MKIYSVLLLTAMWTALGADKRITFASIGLGTTCAAIAACKVWSSYADGKAFDEALERRKENGSAWTDVAKAMEKEGGFDNKGFSALYKGAKELGILERNNETMEEFFENKQDDLTFDQWVDGRIAKLKDSYFTERPLLFTLSTNCLGAAGVLFLIYGGYRYRSESLKG